MKYADLRDFLAQLEARGELKRITQEIDPHLEMTEICDRVLKAEGPALLFEKPKGHAMPVLGNLFGTVKRVALGMGEESAGALRGISMPSPFMVSLNAMRSSPRSMASTCTPITFTPKRSRTPARASSEDRFKPDCPPRFGSRASGLSFAMISSMDFTFKGSM